MRAIGPSVLATAKVVAQGFATAEQEYEDGINAVAAPVLDPEGLPVAAIAVTGPAYRLSVERMRAIGPSVLATAKVVAQGLHAATVVAR